MKKKGKRMVSLVLAAVLCLSGLAGCAKSKSSGSGEENGPNAQETKADSKAMGRYLESENTLPAELIYMTDIVEMAQDESLHMAGGVNGAAGFQLYRSFVDGEAWVPQDMPGFMTQNWASISSVMLSPQGEIFLELLDQEENGGSNNAGYWLISADGEAKQCTISLPGVNGSTQNYIDRAEFSDDGRLYIYDEQSQAAYEIDKDSGGIGRTFSGDGSALYFGAVAGSQLILITKSGMIRYDRSSGEELPEDAVLAEHLKQVVTEETSIVTDVPLTFTSGEDGSLFFADTTGIYHHEEGGSVCEQLLNGALSSLSAPNTKLCRLVRISDEEFLVSVLADDKAKLFTYTYDPDVAAVPETELQLYALEDSDYLQQVVADFKKEHPEMYVKLQIGLSGQDGMTEADALRTLNTDILADKGPDVLILDGMPIDSYIDKNILEDLSPLLEEIKKQDGLFDNITKAYARDGKVCAVPANFMIPITAGDKASAEAAASLDELAVRAEELKNQEPAQSVFDPYLTAELLLRDLILADSSGWMGDNQEISQEKLTTFLQASKRLYETRIKPSEDEKSSNSPMDNRYFSRRIFDNLEYYIQNMGLKSSRIVIGNLGSMKTYSIMMSCRLKEYPEKLQKDFPTPPVNENLRNTEFEITDSGERKTFIPTNIVGVTKTSDVREAAETFVKTILGSSTSANRTCLSVNQKAFEEACVDPTSSPHRPALGGSLVANWNEDHTEYDGYLLDFCWVWPTQEELAGLKSMIESLNSPSLNDTVVMNMVMEQGVKYLRGEQDLDKTAADIMQKIKLYQAE